MNKVRKHHENQGNGRNEWLTPPQIIKALGAFDLDPAVPCAMAHEGKPWRTARKLFCKCNDGLSKAWIGRVWLNPPYGGDTELWLERLAAYGNGIALVFARTETRWFKRVVWDKADALMFLHRRISFYLPDGSTGGRRGGTGSATAASVLVAYGDSNVDALRDAELDGFVVARWEAKSVS